MKKTNYSIQIDNPCAENWNAMTKTDKGKFCAMCEKNVIDFSKLTDNEILKIIESNTNGNKNLCGRFTQTQLNRVLIDTNPQTSPKLYQFLAGLLLFSANANAITEKPKIENFGKETKDPIIWENDTIPKTKNQTDFTITRKIIDVWKEAIPGASIVLKGNKQIATVSNDNGEFSLSIPEKMFKNSLVLDITSMGYKDTTFVISKKDAENKKPFFVELKEDEMLELVPATMGAIKRESIEISIGVICVIPGTELKESQKSSKMIGSMSVNRTRKWWQFWKRRR